MDLTNQMPIATKGSSLEVSNLKVLKNLACKIANKTKSGETILLYGKLGVGKTTFARFFINHLQKKTNSEITEVPSPTFTIMYEYCLIYTSQSPRDKRQSRMPYSA